VPELLSGLPAAAVGLARGKMTPGKILLHPHKASKEVKRIFENVDGRDERIELNLYIVGYDEDAEPAAAGVAPGSGPASETKPEPEADAAGAAERAPATERQDPPGEEEGPSSTEPESES
jgi:succinate dehydrogenase / fumarate reductase iron-sulfur subunit